MSPLTKRYLRLIDLFAYEKPMEIVSNKVEFMTKYAQLYPTHLNFEEKFTVRIKTENLPFFLRVPSYRKRITLQYTISSLTLKETTCDESTKELLLEI